MNELDFISRWERDKPVYRAWGEFVVDIISEKLKEHGKDLGCFLKVPVKSRLKENSSLVDKAFYRPAKSYSNPYDEIEDKVGVRFIVLLLEDIREICGIIEGCDKWMYDACKHFDEDKERDPLLFTYQSVHYVVRSKELINVGDVEVSEDTPCEIQIRTLLQHAHAELTHDAIYKAKKTVQPKVHRTVAKSMALIETTDDFFSSVTKQLNHGPLEEYGVVERLDGLYFSLTNIRPHVQKSSIVVWDAYEEVVDENLVDKIQQFLNKPEYSVLPSLIKKKYSENVFYQQSMILFIYWMLVNRRQRLLRDWPFDKVLLDPFALDVGVSTWGVSSK